MVSKRTGLLVFVGAVAAVAVGSAVALSKKTDAVQLYAIVDGAYDQGTVSYTPAESEQFATTVPSGSTPVTIQGYDTNVATGVITQGNVFTWDVSATGYTYLINSAPKAAGTYLIWTVVEFLGGSSIQSNTITVKVSG